MEVCRVKQRTINLFVLDKQFLLAGAAPLRALAIAEGLVGLHASRPDVPYLSLAARIAGFEVSQLDRLMYEDRKLIRTHAMRGTVHLVTLSQYSTILAATLGQLDAMYRRSLRHLTKLAFVEDAIIQAVADHGPLSHAEIVANVPLANLSHSDVHHVLNHLCTQQQLVKTTVNASWRSGAYNYDLLKRWLPSIPEIETDKLAAQKRLLEWYVASYGPATLLDICWWTGWRRRHVKELIANARIQASQVYFEALGTDAYILAGDLERIHYLKVPNKPRIHFLPAFDPYVMAYAARGRYITDRSYGRVFRGVSGIVEPVILRDGEIVGTWGESKTDHRLELRLFERAGKRELKSIASAAQQTSTFLREASATITSATEFSQGCGSRSCQQ